ncbi:MAG TPA: pyruvate:ferredoxin (flavodoxin) oxidoreductase, partial [Polyangiaceae bacterium]|nr:pyruvate:ferredoxin (flavodoxin) oxidoreductase [Polyangiaceae bacterium]
MMSDTPLLESLETLDANEAVASVAYRLNEVIAIYPITPASAMGELADVWNAEGRQNIWGAVPVVTEMQSEGGAAGAIHGAVTAGALGTTFTASQGLLLMIPNLYKLAGELTPLVIHVAARSIATHALSIFGDHSDVMACRQTGVGLLCSSSVQAAHDLALIAHSASLKSRIPFLHFFDGFRTSHEIRKIAVLSDDALRRFIDPSSVLAHRNRGLSPDRPALRGTAQNPDTFFQAREACNAHYAAAGAIVSAEMQRFAELTGRAYAPFEYSGHPEATRVVVCMGSGAETVRETARHLAAGGARVGALEVRLYRPFLAADFAAQLPATVTSVAVLDRTKEPGAPGEPLYLDVSTALSEERGRAAPTVFGGRYGLSSKEFTPAMVARVFRELDAPAPKRHFTVGIVDDVSHLSLDVTEPLSILPATIQQAVFFGLGSDGTVGANKNSIKIIADETGYQVQAYFVYDSKKAGAVTVSHLRFGPERFEAPYLIESAQFIGCHQFDLLEKLDVLGRAEVGATLLLNSPYAADAVWHELPREVQEQLISKRIQLFVVDAYRVARESGLGRHINTIMQTCFFHITQIVPEDRVLALVKGSIEKSYQKKGSELVRRNLLAVDVALSHLTRVPLPEGASGERMLPPLVSPRAPDFVQRVTATLLAGKGDLLPVSAFPVDGSWPTATSQWEKRNLASEIPVWDSKLCIQCNKCALMCPHAAIRAKVYDPDRLANAPAGFASETYRGLEFKGRHYTLQVAPEDCTGCRLCVEVCPAKDKANPRHKALEMQPQRERRAQESVRYDFFLGLPELEAAEAPPDVKGSQLLRPLFEYSGACPGCGETPYVKLLTQLFGDRLLIANATGCSSIYGGNLPTTPYCTDSSGRGPAWSNSLFEDNAEFGYGFRLALEAQQALAEELLRAHASELGETLVEATLSAGQASAAEIAQQRERVAELSRLALGLPAPDGELLRSLLQQLVKKSVWLVGGDGWAYDIGYGGLDHVLASHRDVNILVLDTEVYSNTGGQQSKATPLGASAKFAAAGKETPK